MKGDFGHEFSIRRIHKITDEEYIEALRIYNESIPFEIRTPTNEINLWLSKNKENNYFEIFVFVLYLDGKLIGLSMTTYLKKSKIVVDEYLAVLDQYRINTIFVVYLSLIQSYYKENNIDYSYYITEISNKDSGESINWESQISLKVLCAEEFGKINAPYYTLPLGLDNYESNFEAILYIKTNDNIKSISKETYLQIVKSIYYDYFLVWYEKLMNAEEVIQYKQEIQRNFELIQKKVLDYSENVSITNSNCIALNPKNYFKRTAGTIPVTKKQSNKAIFLIICAVFILPVIIILGYSKLMMLINIPLSSATSIIGSVITVVITSLVTLYISTKK
ncbi:hypothetical protein H6A65_00760 [Mediterraneibacter glycyrrhizinilyticus]|uniref:hypothetical protein n=1 Tax=Mediterraneibacter glycyrrhizinilyticus TaxID=342942 RepID=UPI0019620859|nr:hypothetical protein [Mediterraneibacter glycyrrhizinilyticus]MBM6750034.1 hypothetical protein [Mediterraneibacter glycyrrhizinilyticus]